MANTYQLIASSTVGSGGAATIEFTSIPQTYTDLLIKLSTRSTRSQPNADQYIQFNSNTSTVYKMMRLLGNGSAVASDAVTGSDSKGAFVGMATGSTATASTFASTDIYIFNYTSTNSKSISVDSVTEYDTSSPVYQVFHTSLWNPSTQAAITSILIGAYTTENFAQYSTAYLYGIKNS